MLQYLKPNRLLPHLGCEMHDCAIVITSCLRPTLTRAVRSIFQQNFAGSLHILIGVDLTADNSAARELARPALNQLIDECPAHCRLTLIDVGYSTARQRGGLYTNSSGGVMPTVSTLAADSRYVAYLDDDDWYGPEHISTLLEAVGGRAWGFSLSWYVNPANAEPMCIDMLESAGPGRGAYRAALGGFVRPSCLMIDQLQCAEFLHHWSLAATPEDKGSDRRIFRLLATRRPGWGESGVASVFYTLTPTDINHTHRLVYAAAQGYDIRRVPGHEQVEQQRAAGESFALVSEALADLNRVSGA